MVPKLRDRVPVGVEPAGRAEPAALEAPVEERPPRLEAAPRVLGVAGASRGDLVADGEGGREIGLSLARRDGDGVRLYDPASARPATTS